MLLNDPMEANSKKCGSTRMADIRVMARAKEQIKALSGTEFLDCL